MVNGKVVQNEFLIKFRKIFLSEIRKYNIAIFCGVEHILAAYPAHAHQQAIFTAVSVIAQTVPAYLRKSDIRDLSEICHEPPQIGDLTGLYVRADKEEHR